MGNSMVVDWQEQLQHQFVKKKCIEHTLLGTIEIYNYVPDDSVQIFSKIIQLSDQQYFKEKTKLKHPNLLRALFIEKCSNFCSRDQDSYRIYYDYPGDQTLETIMKTKQKPFLESAIWSIIFQVVDCAEYLQNQFKSISNINLNTLYPLDKQLKIFEANHLFNIMSSYDQAQQNFISILSPEQIEALEKNVRFPQINNFKSDVYSFGIVLLCLTTKNDYKSFYNQFNQLNKNNIFQSLQTTKQNYSELLYGLIQKMLLDDPEQRQSWIDLKKFLGPYKLLQEKDQPFYLDIKLCPQITPQLQLPLSPQKNQIIQLIPNQTSVISQNQLNQQLQRSPEVNNHDQTQQIQQSYRQNIIHIPQASPELIRSQQQIQNYNFQPNHFTQWNQANQFIQQPSRVNQLNQNDYIQPSLPIRQE